MSYEKKVRETRQIFKEEIDASYPDGKNRRTLAMANHFDLKILLTSGHTEKAGGQTRQKRNLIMKPYTLIDLARRVQSFLGEFKTKSS